MAAPNLINSTTVLGKRAYAILTTSMANVITNGSTSGNLIKISEMSISNISSLAILTNVAVGRGTTLYYLAGNISVPANSILTLVSRDSAFYMEEGDYLQANSSSATAGHVSVSHEVTS
jgi:hypothetical protein